MPADGSLYRATGRRDYVGSTYWPTQADMHDEQSQGAAGHTYLHQNGWKHGEDAFDLVHRGWVPAPYASPLVNDPGTELTFTVDVVTPGSGAAGLGGFVEFKMTCDQGDVTPWLTRGMKLRWAGGYGLVCTINVDVVWVVMPIGSVAPTVAAVITDLFVSSAAAPFGWPVALTSWEYVITSPIDGSGWANDPTAQPVDPSSGDLGNDGNRYKSPSSAWVLHIPGGPFELSWACEMDGTRNTLGNMILIAGLSQGGNARPVGDLEDRLVVATTRLQYVFKGRANRDLLNTGDVHNWALSVADAASTNALTVRTDLRPVVLKARLRYNGA
jgi:hypothetical protein